MELLQNITTIPPINLPDLIIILGSIPTESIPTERDEEIKN